MDMKDSDCIKINGLKGTLEDEMQPVLHTMYPMMPEVAISNKHLPFYLKKKKKKTE